MRRMRQTILLAILLVAHSSWAESDSESEVVHAWSATIFGDHTITSNRHGDDDVGAFFDRYDFTPNKSRSFPLELGIRELAYDRFGLLQTPQLQLRFVSPTSNLGISGSQIDEPFFNQRANIFARREGVALDLDYRRLRTEELRWFPNTRGRQFDDLTGSDDRFDRDRTGLFAAIRLRPAQSLSGATQAARWLEPELSLRGGVEDRDGSQQFRFIQEGTNRWGSLTQNMDQKSTKAGAGILVAPGGLFTMSFDVDLDQFRNASSTIVESDLGSGFAATDETIGFIPDSDRITATVLMQSRIKEHAVLEGGFHVSRLEQVDDFTPMQIANGLEDNRLLFYSLNASGDVNVSERVSVNAFFKYDQRKNEIQRDTPLFNPIDNQVQFGPFLKRWDRIFAGAEAVYALHRSNLVALGARYEWIDRDLEFGLPTNLVIPEANTLVAERTQMWSVYGRTNLRPVAGLGVSGEVGYRGAPDTGYALDLDKYVYGKLRASYRIPIEPTMIVSTFVRGGSGENRDFMLRNGVGSDPAGSSASVKFDRDDIAWGATVTSYPLDDLSVFASFFQNHTAQKYDLVLSDLQRYRQSVGNVDFAEDGSPDLENKQMSFVLGSHLRFSDATDASLSYSFTRAEIAYDSAGESTNVRRIADARSLDADIHGVQTEIGHWLREGLRLQVGYRLQWFDDATSRPDGTGSVVRPTKTSSTQHSVMLGVTFTSDLAAKDD